MERDRGVQTVRPFSLLSESARQNKPAQPLPRHSTRLKAVWKVQVVQNAATHVAVGARWFDSAGCRSLLGSIQGAGFDFESPLQLSTSVLEAAPPPIPWPCFLGLRC